MLRAQSAQGPQPGAQTDRGGVIARAQSVPRLVGSSAEPPGVQEAGWVRVSWLTYELVPAGRPWLIHARFNSVSRGLTVGRPNRGCPCSLRGGDAAART